jgi:hypothetical protein
MRFCQVLRMCFCYIPCGSQWARSLSFQSARLRGRNLQTLHGRLAWQPLLAHLCQQEKSNAHNAHNAHNAPGFSTNMQVQQSARTRLVLLLLFLQFDFLLLPWPACLSSHVKSEDAKTLEFAAASHVRALQACVCEMSRMSIVF